MKIKFWGVRGSHPVCNKEYINYGGNTTCISIEVEDKLFIIDAGTGIIELEEFFHEKYNEFNIFFTHMHIDHIQGFMFFKPLYIKNKIVNLFGPVLLNNSFYGTIKNLMSNNLFPVGVESMTGIKSVNLLKDENSLEISLKTGKLKIISKFLNIHPKGGVIIYKFIHENKSFVFATDVEGKKGGLDELIEFSKNVDLLIHDAQYEDEEYEYKKGWGHSTGKMAIENAKFAEVKMLCLTHYNSNNTDDFLDKKYLSLKKDFENLIMAKEGLEIIL